MKWIYGIANMIGIRSPKCGHWRGEFLDGMCFECNLDRIEDRTWRNMLEAINLAGREGRVDENR